MQMVLTRSVLVLILTFNKLNSHIIWELIVLATDAMICHLPADHLFQGSNKIRNLLPN